MGHSTKTGKTRRRLSAGSALFWTACVAVPLAGCGIACSLVPPDSWVPVHWDAAWEPNRWGPGSELHRYLWLMGGIVSFCNLVLALSCIYADELAAFHFPPPTEQDIRKTRIVIIVIAAIWTAAVPIWAVLTAQHAIGG